MCFNESCYWLMISIWCIYRVVYEWNNAMIPRLHTIVIKDKSEFRLCLGIPIIGDYSFVSLFAIFSLLSEDVGG